MSDGETLSPSEVASLMESATAHNKAARRQTALEAALLCYGIGPDCPMKLEKADQDGALRLADRMARFLEGEIPARLEAVDA
jgi:hypothetical protein